MTRWNLKMTLAKTKRKQERDPFYSKENLARLKRHIEQDDGKRITFTWEEFEDFSKAAQQAKTQKERDLLIQRAQKGWSNA